MRLTERDLDQLSRRGISAAEANRQLDLLDRGTPPTRLHAAATIGHGIWDERAQGACLEPRDHDREEDRSSLVRFTPASGAATRMFKSVRQAVDDPDGNARVLAELSRDGARLPFADQLDLSSGLAVAESMLSSSAALADRPKGLLPFHRLGRRVHTAFEDQAHESRRLFAALRRDGELHLTVSSEHLDSFREAAERLRAEDPSLPKLSFSLQHQATDTLSTGPTGELIRTGDETSELVLRPGGHGALIENLRALAERGVSYALLKNIDNVVPESLQQSSIDVQTSLFRLCEKLTSRRNAALEHRDDAAGEAIEELTRELRQDATVAQALAGRGDLEAALRRPLRVCGVVRNTGEPGGGPFWVEADGDPALQIVESSQIDRSNPQQASILESSTHFNPVLLACSLHDEAGKPFELERFIDHSTSFIATKTLSDGSSIRALERPGLWNGTMARWITFFVEVPEEAFSPVKTVFDLLRPVHQWQR